MNENRSQYGVLTGDLVGSSKLSPTELRDAIKVLRKGAAEFDTAFPNSVWGDLDVFSGDGWQLLLRRSDLSLRAAIFLRCKVKGVEGLKLDSRVALAWGQIDEETVNPKRVSEASGKAFTASGRALSGMPKRRRFDLGVTDSGFEMNFLGVSMGLLDELAGHWTTRQAQVLALTLLNKNQEDVATALDKVQSTIAQALQTAGWSGIDGFLNKFEYRLQSR